MNSSSTLESNFTEITNAIVFSLLDYIVFSAMLILSVLIGIYFGFFKNKQPTTEEYLLGGKTMNVFPVACSLIASYISSVSLLSIPAEVYRYGASYWLLSIAHIVNALVACYIFMPVFLNVKITSAYNYLQIRFDNKIRKLATLLFILSIFLYNSIVIYAPVLAFSQVTGLSLHLVTPLVCIICIFYTTIGGLKAVVWTDTLQTMSIVICMTVVLIMGLVSVGGFSAVWEKSVQGQRLDILNFNLDFTQRDTFWALAIGGSLHIISIFSVDQVAVQRFLALSTLPKARRAVLIFCIGTILLLTMNVMTGLIIYAKYAGCDPLTTGQIQYIDQLVPHYVMEVTKNFPGLPGLFMAGIFSAGLSSLSTTLNTLSGTIYEEFIVPFVSTNISQKRTSNILKLTVILTGVLSTAMVFVVEHLGGILPLVISFSSVAIGPLLGLFCLGMLIPIANPKGTLCGGILGLVLNSWLIFGNQWYKMKGIIKDPVRPFSINSCPFSANITQESQHIPIPDQQPFVLYRINFWYFVLVGAFVTVISGFAVSYITRKQNVAVDKNLISPVVRFFVYKETLNTSLVDCNNDIEMIDKSAPLLGNNLPKDAQV